MKIKTKLLLFLLPTMIGGIIFIASILSYNWYQETIDNFKTKLKTKTMEYAYNLPKKDYFIENKYPIDNIYISDIPPKLCNNKITEYIPVEDKFLIAETNKDTINKKLKQGFVIISLTTCFTLFLMSFALFFISRKIAKPIDKLNNSALSIAAGQYGEMIEIKGPKELMDLSQTLNTMSVCLLENISRLQENSILREKAYGEYECSILLQKHMLQKVIDEYLNDRVSIKAISFYSENPNGFLLDLPKNSGSIHMNLIEVNIPGFEEMYSLLTNYRSHQLKNQPLHHGYSQLKITIEKNNIFSFQSNEFLIPFIWSEKKLISKNNIPLQIGDYIIICNKGLLEFYSNIEEIKKIISRIFYYFSEDGLNICVKMLQKELFFHTKKLPLKNDLHLLCAQILF